jgi:phosphate transport system permease protein
VADAGDLCAQSFESQTDVLGRVGVLPGEVDRVVVEPRAREGARLAVAGQLDPQSCLQINFFGCTNDLTKATFLITRAVDRRPMQESFTVGLGALLGGVVNGIDYRTNLVLDSIVQGDESLQMVVVSPGQPERAATRPNKMARLTAAGGRPGDPTLDIWRDSAGRLSWAFLTSLPSRLPERAGILTALVGSAYVIALTAAMALPLGVAAAIYLEEYGSRSRMARLIEINISNLAAVPSIIYGLLGLGLFVRVMGLGRSVIAGAATLALLALPVVILATREALRTVPGTLREASYALGATKWQTILYQVLPVALPGILTGLILSLSRAIGETAPLITIGALTYVPFLPTDIWSPFTVLPIQIFNWVSRPQAEFLQNASAGIIVLLTMLLVMNAAAIWLRDRHQRRRLS